MNYLLQPAGFIRRATLFLSFIAAGIAAAAAEPPVKPCPVIPNPDALRELAQQCAKGLALDANCRAHIKDGTEDFIITKDCSAAKPQGYLIIPVRPVTGVDDGQILSAPLARLWEDAWRWSRIYPGRGPEKTALAVNSKSGRSQNQLHIHISCVLPEVAAALGSTAIPSWPAKPVTLTLGPGRNAYKAVKVARLSGEDSPFAIAVALAGAPGKMKDQSIAVVGAPNGGGYYVLTTTAGGANRGHAEELLDQACAP